MNTKSRKKIGSVIAIYAIILAIYIITFLIIPFNKTAASWVSFAFTITAIVSSLIVFNIAFNSKEDIVSKIYGYPIFKIGVIYAITQFAIGIITCVVAAFVRTPYFVALIPSIMLLGIAAIGVIITENTRDIIEEIDATAKEDVKTITHFQICVNGIIDACENDELKEKLETLHEQFKFSDPVSSESTKEAEEKINALLSDLRVSVEAKSIEEANDIIKKIANATNERNRICKATKSSV